jgi:putative transport protein
LEAVKHSAPPENLSRLMAEPVVGYSIAYPGGVLGMILAMLALRWFWRVDFKREAESIRGAIPEVLENKTIRVKSPEAGNFSVERLVEELELNVAFSRHRRGDTLSVVTPETQLQPGDLVSVVGAPEAVASAVAALGEETDVRLEFDRSELDFRRIFVSNPKLAGKTIESLELDERFGAVATRIRRGDIDLAALPDTEIEIGDRVRIVAPPAQMDALGRFFGDSYRAASELDILTFSLGLALGLAVGLIPIPVAPGIRFKLGLAGGPLIVALILGKLDRTGPLAWNPPFGSNVTLRQIGLVIFLAGVGTQAGYAFVSTLFARGGALIFALGLSVTLTAAFSALVVGYKVLRIPLGLLFGILAGLQTQPAMLGFAVEQTKNDLPNVGYASVFPFATILKIILAQVLFLLLQ